MTVALDTHCLFSTLKNVSGGRMVFGFLPPHGRELQANEEFTMFGNVLDAVANRNGDRVSSRRHIQAFEAAINRGDLAILHTPAPILTDTSTGASKMVTVAAGVIGSADPCWSDSGSVVDDLSGGRDFIG